MLGSYENRFYDWLLCRYRIWCNIWWFFSTTVSLSDIVQYTHRMNCCNSCSIISVLMDILIVTHTHTYTHTTILWLYGFCPGQPGWASTRRIIRPLINCPLSASSIYYDSWHPPCSVQLYKKITLEKARYHVVKIHQNALLLIIIPFGARLFSLVD